MAELSEPNEQIQELLKALEKIDLVSVVGQNFKNQDIYLDGREFVDCKFKNCRLITHLGHCRLSGHYVIKDCKFDFMYPASTVWATTLKLQGLKIPYYAKSETETKNPLGYKK